MSRNSESETERGFGGSVVRDRVVWLERLAKAWLCVVWLLPVQAIYMPPILPLETKPDRVLLPILAVAIFLYGRPALRAAAVRRGGWIVPPAVQVMLALFGGLTVLSTVAGLPEILHAGNGKTAVRVMFQYASYGACVVIFCLVASVVNWRSLLRWNLVLACLAAIGTIVEAQTNFNVFYWLARFVAVGGFVEQPPLDIAGARANTVGPTAHGLAIATALAMAIPYMLTLRIEASRVVSAAASSAGVALLIAGGLATERRTALILPLVAIAVVALLVSTARTRLPLLIAATAATLMIAAPNQTVNAYDQLAGRDEEGAVSAQGRSRDYPAVAPMLAERPLLGQGIGRLTNKERILDNQVLGELVAGGVLGLAAYLGLIAALGGAFVSRCRQQPEAACFIAAALTFLVSNLLYDSLGFPHTPYGLATLFGISLAATYDRAGVPHNE